MAPACRGPFKLHIAPVIALCMSDKLLVIVLAVKVETLKLCSAYRIKKPENALKWINYALDKKEVVMGFGHRVYKKGDSRVPTMEKYFKKVSKIKNDKKFLKIYDIVKNVMIERKDIHPNVDFPTGPTYHLMGFDTDFFTPIFVLSRITGWSAHIMEQHAANKLIRPLSKYSGEKHRKVMLLNQR